MKDVFLRNKRTVVCAVVLLLTPTIAWYAYKQFRTLKVVRAAQSAASLHRFAFTLYSTEVLRQGPLRDSPGRIATKYVVAQRSDGTRAELTIYFPGESQEHRSREIRFPDSTIVVARDSIGMKTTWPRVRNGAPDPTVTHRPVPASNCLLNSLGQPAFPAYQLKGTKQRIRGIDLDTTEIVEGGSPAIEAWYAPQLDCEQVYRFATFYKNGTVTDSSEKFATSYTLGDPSATLFDTSSLQEVSPVTSFVTQYRKLGYPEDIIQKKVPGLQRYEQKYLAMHN
jgi:hypothetical protein